MGSCILTFSLQSTFKLLLLLLLCFSYTIDTTTSQSVQDVLRDLECQVVNCGEGTCTASNATLLGIDCDCKPGWKEIPLVSYAIPSCVLPNCTIDFQCGSKTPLPPPPPPNLDPSSPCKSVWCGNGNCVVNDTSYYCQCDQGFANLFGNSMYACFAQCYFGADCKNLGLGPPAPPPSTNSGTTKTGTKGPQDGKKGTNGANNVKSFQALIIVIIALIF